VRCQSAAKFARLDQLELYYETLGTGPPLVLIHGSLMTVGLLNDYPALLAAHRQVIAVELPSRAPSTVSTPRPCCSNWA
jgi:pimeloyl-ACP methyl ester carboxylesterase